MLSFATSSGPASVSRVGVVEVERRIVRMSAAVSRLLWSKVMNGDVLELVTWVPSPKNTNVKVFAVGSPDDRVAFVADSNGPDSVSAGETVVRLGDQSEHRAKLIGFDARTDRALMKIEAKNLPMLPFGDSDRLQVGEPMGLEHLAYSGGAQFARQWLLIKHRDYYTTTEDVTELAPVSILSRRSLAEIAEDEGGNVKKAATGDPKVIPRRTGVKRRKKGSKAKVWHSNRPSS